MNRTVPARRWQKGLWNAFDETVSCEEAVRVRWRADGFASVKSVAPAPLSGDFALWAWPCDLEVLALGHVLLEGPEALMADVLQGAATARVVAPGTNECSTKAGQELFFEVIVHKTEERLASEMDADLPLGSMLTPEGLLTRMECFMNLPGLWDSTGCFHRAAAFALAPGNADVTAQAKAPTRSVQNTAQPRLFVEDTGRHNCLDRLAGKAFQAGLDLRAHALFITARLTASLYAKARRAGFGVLVSRSAVSSAAVHAAQQDGVTLVGFCRHREERCTVFADAKARIA